MFPGSEVPIPSRSLQTPRQMLRAEELINEIKPQIAVPIHYGLIVGNKEDANSFADLVDKEIECKILIR